MVSIDQRDSQGVHVWFELVAGTIRSLLVTMALFYLTRMCVRRRR